jgi:hypothetical protein
MKKYFLYSILIIALFVSFSNVASATAPVITAPASEITATSAKITVTVNSFDSALFPLNLSLGWAKTGEAVKDISLDTLSLTPANLPYTKIITLDSLTADTSYSYRVMRSGAPISDIFTFTTPQDVLPLMAVAETPANIKAESATLKATVKNPGDAFSDYNLYFEYTTDEHYQLSGFTDKNYFESIYVTDPMTGATDKSVTASVKGLTADTEYHFRLKIETTMGDHLVVYSNEKTFTTPASSFVVITPTNNTTNTTTATTTSTVTTTGELIPCGTTKNSAPCEGAGGWDNLMKLINNVVTFIFVRLAVPIAAIMFAYAGFELLTSGGDVAKLKKAKSVFTNVAIGLIFVAASWLIVHTILITLGYTGLDVGF